MAPQSQPSLAEDEAVSVTSHGRADRAASVSLRVTAGEHGEKGQGSGLENDQQADLLSIGAWTSGEHALNVDGDDAEVTASPYDLTILEINVATTISTEHAQSPDNAAITKLYVLILSACQNDRADVIFATEYTGDTVVGAQDEANSATMEVISEI